MQDVVLASPEHARELTDRIKVAVEGTWLLIQQAYTGRAWSALGYATWDDYCTREFGTSRLRLPREERQEVVASLREIGMSTRAIATATGVSDWTVRQELAPGARNLAPAPAPVDVEPDVESVAAAPSERPDPAPIAPSQPRITGTDGKKYKATPARTAQRPRTDVVSTVNRALLRAQEAARAADEITRQHLAGRAEEAATWGRSLSASLESLQRLQDRLNGVS